MSQRTMFGEPEIQDSEASGADIEGPYRYRLWRRWGPGPKLVICGFNPSIAEAARDDPTIRKDVGYAKRWRFGAIEKINLMAYVATDPRDLQWATAPLLGPRNTGAWHDACRGAGKILAAWGDVGRVAAGRTFNAAAWEDLIREARWVLTGYGDVLALGLTKHGQPLHTGRTSYDLRPFVHWKRGKHAFTG